MSTKIKGVEVVEHGNYLYGTLDGVDFVQSGKLEDGTKYGASVKLKFITRVTAVKNVGGIDVATKKAISQIIRIPTTDTDLPVEVAKYNDLIGKDLLISYNTPDNHTYSVPSEVKVLVGGEDKKVTDINEDTKN